MTDLEILNKFAYKGQIEGIFDLVSQAIYTRNWSAINLEKCHSEIDEVFQWIPIKIRYDELFERSGKELSFAAGGFSIYGHLFQTLDEVEKAINNKAFI